MSVVIPIVRDRKGRVYQPAIGRWLRPLLWTILIGFALLAANGVYLAAVKALTWWSGAPQETVFYFFMFIFHLVLGFVLIVPFIVFGFSHLVTSWKRPNKAAVRYGLILLMAAIILLISGLVLVRISDTFVVKDPKARAVSYWLHVGTPILAIVLYIRHRLAGPRIRWEWAKVWGASVAGFIVLMGFFHKHDFRAELRSRDAKYTFPSEAKLAGGKLISARSLMMDDYCLKCHKDAYEGWYHSSHHFSSFNNKFYLTSVRETRQVSLKRDGTTRAARWCAGCHDPVPFFSGEFDDPNYDDVNNPTSQAGITCTACHAITKIDSTRGNADYTIEEPQHYPFAYSDDRFLQWVNQTLVKAKPEMHKRTFLRPEVQRNSAFCSTCHKVGIPFALNHWQDFVRGQNHWDTFLLSGVSGGGARSFYYPPPEDENHRPNKAKSRCNDCHMTPIASNDFGARRDFDQSGLSKIHNHLFPGANTALPFLRGQSDVVKIQADFLKDKRVRVDLFALREGGEIDGAMLGPIRPETPTVQPGGKYLVETVVRTLGLGHPFSQGTVDSNEIWVELTVKADGKVIGHSGGTSKDGEVDPYSHFINVYMLDRDGKRIDRRNPQDIFVPLYNKQIPPGAGQIVHFGLEVPPNIKGPIELEAKVNYRKFDRKYLDYIFGPGKGPSLPVVVMAMDFARLSVAGGPEARNDPSPIKETWQRWNDYGIGLFLEGTDKGGQKGELKQAEPVFHKVAEMGRADGWVNLARVYQREGRIPDALSALEKASTHKEPAAPWVIAWLSAQIDERNGFLDEAIAKYRSVLDTKIPARGFDFSHDYEIINAMGAAQLGRAKLFPPKSQERLTALEESAATFRRTLETDSENVSAHYNLGIVYSELVPAYQALSLSAAIVGVEMNAATSRVQGEEGITEGSRLLADPKTRRQDRIGLALLLGTAVGDLMKGGQPKFGSRLNQLQALVTSVGPLMANENDAELKAVLARTLSASHKALHSTYKVDETAEGRAVRLAREHNPAADMNAQSIVIHPLHRPGAPGLPVDSSLGVTTSQTERREGSR